MKTARLRLCPFFMNVFTVLLCGVLQTQTGSVCLAAAGSTGSGVSPNSVINVNITEACSDAGNQALREIGRYIQEDKARNGDLTDPEYVNRTEKSLRAWCTTAVLPNLIAAENDDTRLVCAIRDYLIFDKTLSLLAFDDRFEREKYKAEGSMTKGINNAIVKSAKKCAENADLRQIRIMLQLSSWGATLNLPGVEDFESVWQRIDKLLHFELVFESMITGPENYHHLKSVNIKLRRQDGDDLIYFEGFGRLNYVVLDGEFTRQENLTVTTENGYLNVPWAYINFPDPGPLVCKHGYAAMTPEQQKKYDEVKKKLENDQNSDDRVRMLIRPTDVYEVFTGQTVIGPLVRKEKIWEGLFKGLHYDSWETGEQYQGYAIRQWDPPAGKLYAKKVFKQAMDEVTETTTLELWFTPQI